MKILVIDTTTNRGLAFARTLLGAKGADVYLYTRRYGAALRIRVRSAENEDQEVDSIGECDVVFHHYRDPTMTAALTAHGIEIWYGGGGPEEGEGRRWHVHSPLDADTIKSWPQEWVRQLVEWATMASVERDKAPVPLLLRRPAPDALVAYHLLALLGAVSEDVKQAALKEAKAIAGAKGMLNIDDATERAAFIRKWC